MSNTRYPDHHYSAVHKIPNHHYHHHYNLNQRNDSDDEIDVFEATKYFAAGASSIHQKSMLFLDVQICHMPLGGCPTAKS